MVQDIKFGVKLVAGGQKNDTLGHNNARRIVGDTVVTPTSVAPTDGEGGLTNGGEAAEAASMATKGTRRLPAVHLEVSRASAGAIQAVEAQGGTVTCAHFNRLALRALVRRALRLRKQGDGSSAGSVKIHPLWPLFLMPLLPVHRSSSVA